MSGLLGREGALRLEEEHIPHRLDQGQYDRQVAHVLVDLLLPRLAFLGQRLELRDHHRQQLEDDLRGDVGHDAQGEHRHTFEGAAREEVEEGEDPAPSDQILDGLQVDARNGDERPQPVHGDDERREEESLPEVRQLPSVQ